MEKMKKYSQEEIEVIKSKIRNDPDLVAYMGTMTRCCMMVGFWAASDKTKLTDMDESYQVGLDYGELILRGSSSAVTDYLYARGLMDERIDVAAAVKEAVKLMEEEETEEA